MVLAGMLNLEDRLFRVSDQLSERTYKICFAISREISCFWETMTKLFHASSDGSGSFLESLFAFIPRVITEAIITIQTMLKRILFCMSKLYTVFLKGGK